MTEEEQPGVSNNFEEPQNLLNNNPYEAWLAFLASQQVCSKTLIS